MARNKTTKERGKYKEYITKGSVSGRKYKDAFIRRYI